jgi:two-component system, OmpR family, sensor histidine kinase BaeS
MSRATGPSSRRARKSPPRRLMSRTLVLVSGALAAFILVLSLVLLASSGSLLRSWEARENAALRSFMAERLGDLVLELERSGREPTPQGVSAALAGLPYEPEWAAVVAADGSALFLYRRQGAPQGQSRTFLARLQATADWGEVERAGGGLALKYAALMPSFSQSESNRLLAAALVLILAAGSVLAALIAFVVAYSLARPVARQAGLLAAALEQIGKGRRDLEPPSSPIEELERIGRAALALQSDLGKEEELRRRWAADIAHDLRTPLAALKAQLEAMRDGVFSPSARRLEESCREVLRLEKLVNDLALLTRLETPGFSPRLGRLRALPLLAEIAERFSKAAAEKSTSIAVEGDEAELEADADLLDRALGNLVENALRYGDGGGVVVLRARRGPDGGVVIEVSNPGLIDEGILPFVFDRSFRGDPSRESSGSGLGLSIAKAAVEAQGASIEAFRDEAAGRTVFSIAFTASLPAIR